MHLLAGGDWKDSPSWENIPQKVKNEIGNILDAFLDPT
jgi:hypothetical protein